MRICLNKPDQGQNIDTMFQEAFANIKKIYSNFDGTKWEKGRNLCAILYVCPHCGCEIYGEWTVSAICTGEFNENKALQQLLLDHYKVEDFNKIIAQINNHVVPKQLEASIPSLKYATQLTDCPVCSGKLSHESGYLLIYNETNSRASGGSEFDEILNSFCPYQEIEEPHFSYDDIHFDNGEVVEYFCEHYDIDLYVTEKYDLNLEKSLPILLQVVRTAYDDAALTEKWNDYCQSCDVPTDYSPSLQTESIKKSPQKLKEFIQNLLNTEINIYSVSQHLKSLYFIRPEVNRRAIAKTLEPQIHLKEQIKLAQEAITKADDAYKLACNRTKQLKASAPAPVHLIPPAKPVPPVQKTPGLFNKKKVLAENAARQNQFQLDVLAYQEAYQQYLEEKENLENQHTVKHQQDIAAAVENEEIAQKILLDKQHELQALETELEQVQTKPVAASAQSSLKELVDQEIANAETTLKNLYACRNKLYAMDILFVKYRNPVALATFYEYLLAGRCMTLEGPDGAYNMYENQVRADMIIGQLSKVLEKLDEIKETQYLIYSEIQRVNKNLDQMNDTMQKALGALQSMDKKIQHISENSDIIAHNTAVTAHYAKVNAELTNALGYMVAFS